MSKPKQRESYEQMKQRLGVAVTAVVPVAGFYTSHELPCHSKGQELQGPKWKSKGGKR
jgi:hypothetical protein